MAIKATLIKDHTVPAELLQRARLVLANSERSLAERIMLARKSLAQKMRLNRTRLREQAAKIAQKNLEVRLQECTNSLRECFKKEIEEAEAQCLDMVIHLAKQLVSENIHLCHNDLKRRISKALAAIQENSRNSIRINPCHLHPLNNSWDDIKIIGDPQIAPGNAIASATSGTLILNWEKQFSALATEFQSSYLKVES